MKLHLELNEENRIFGYQTFPIFEDRPVYEIDEIPDDLTSGCYGVVNGRIRYLGFTEKQIAIQKEQHDNELRAKREPLLIAFDKWEKAVIRGREEDSGEIMAWYESLLDLNENAFVNIPSRVKYYL